MQCVRDMAVGSKHIQLAFGSCFIVAIPECPSPWKTIIKLRKKFSGEGFSVVIFGCWNLFFSNLAEHLQRLKALKSNFFTYKKHPNPLTRSSRLWASSLHNPLDGSHTYLHNPPPWKRSRQKTNKQLYWLPRTNIRKLIFYDLQSDWLGQFWFLVTPLNN